MRKTTESKMDEAQDQMVRTQVKEAHTNWSLVKSIFFGVSGVIAASSLLLLIVKWAQNAIDASVERKLADPAVLRRIAAEARPAVIFDAGESILADLGAAQFIKNITVTSDKDHVPQTIDCDFTVFLPVAPLLTPLHNDSVTVFTERGKGFGWRFRLEYGMISEAGQGLRKYRLELFR